MSKFIDGIKCAENLKHELSGLTRELKQRTGVQPGLAILRVGKDSASKIYVEKKGLGAQEIGCHFEEHVFSEDVSPQELAATIAKLNQASHIHGIVLQLPLPFPLERTPFLSLIDPVKDVDGLHPFNAGKLFQGIEGGIIPATPLGCFLLLQSLSPALEGKVAGVVGCSILVGRPMAMLLLQQKCTVWMAHTKTHDLPKLCQTADILIVAIGRPGFIQGDWIKEGAIVLDVGINRLPSGEIRGDVDFDAALPRVKGITPVPGGVGPMTVVSLLYNTVKAAYEANGCSFPLNLLSRNTSF